MYFSTERNRRVAEQLFAHVRNATTDQFDEIYEVDLSIYSDPEVARLERERIFERMPMMALHSSQLPEPGSFVTVQLNRTSALVTRGKDGKVRAFQNVCRHRGATLVSVDAGKRHRFSCPYHGWTYTGEGELVGVSFNDTVGIDLPCAKLNLAALPVDERHGFIWIVENPQGAIDLDAHLGPSANAVLADFGLDQYFCYRETIYDFGQNWKIMMDGLIDGYHVQFVHKATISPFTIFNTMGLEKLSGGHAFSVTPRRKIDALLDTEQPGDTPVQKYSVTGVLFQPNVTMQLHPHHVEFWTLYQNPDDPRRSRIHKRFLTPQQTYDERGTEIIEKNWKISDSAIINEDVPIGNGVQAACSTPHPGKGVLGRNEVMNQRFHRAYDQYMAQP